MPEMKLVNNQPDGAVDLPQLPQNLEQTQAVATAISRSLRRAARQARAPTVIVKGGAGFRARKGDRAFRLAIISSFVACVIGPIIFASLYWGLVASDQYSTQMKFTIRAGEKSPLDSLGGMLGVSTSGAQDTQIVADFIRSRAMIDSLQRSLNLKQLYANPGADYFSRFNPSDPVEDLEKYWRKHVDVKVESLSGILAVDVRAFTPEDSQALGSNILDLSEKLVNDMATRARKDAVEQAKKELLRAEQELQSSTAAMREARNAEGVIDARSSAEAIERIVTALRMDLSQLEQDIATLGDAGQDSPQSRIIRSRMVALKTQIADYNKKIASLGNAPGDSSMADRLSALSLKQTDLDLARQRYAMASAVYENARVDLETQHSYLAVSLRPTLAQKALYPRRWLEWSIIVFPAILGWSALVAIAFLVRDHMAK